MPPKQVLLAILLVANGCMPGCVVIPVDTSRHFDAIYRYINVGPGERLNLGEPFRVTSLATRINDSTYVLHREAIPDPDSIEIHVNAHNIVYAMDFIYRDHETFGSLMATYVKSLGPPSRTSNQDAAWEDDTTRFQILWTGGDTVGSVRSRITDRSGSAESGA